MVEIKGRVSCLAPEDSVCVWAAGYCPLAIAVFPAEDRPDQYSATADPRLVFACKVGHFSSSHRLGWLGTPMPRASAAMSFLPPALSSPFLSIRRSRRPIRGCLLRFAGTAHHPSLGLPLLPGRSESRGVGPKRRAHKSALALSDAWGEGVSSAAV